MKRLFLVAIWFCSHSLTWGQLTIGPLEDQKIGLGGALESVDLSAITSLEAEDVFWEVEVLPPENQDDAPSWTVNASNFQFEMNVVAIVTSKQNEAIGDSHILSVLDSDDEVRAVANGIEVEDDWIYFLTIYSNENGESLKYRFYDDSIKQIVSVNNELTFASNEIIGQADDPVELTASFITPSIDDIWLHFEIDDDEFVGTEAIKVTVRELSNPDNSACDTLNVTIANDFEPIISGVEDQTVAFDEQFTTFDLDDFLTNLDGDDVSYNFSGNTDLIVSIDGDNVVSVVKPDSWSGTEVISFLVTDVTENAFSNSQDVSFTGKTEDQAPVITHIDDQITGIGGDFDAIDLTQFVTASNEDAVTWDFEFVTDSIVDPPDWSVDANEFQFNMSVTALATSLGKSLSGDQHILGAFSGTDDILVGTAQPLQVEDDWFFFITIYNNNDTDSIYFNLYDALNQRILPTFEYVTFEANGIIGDALDPLELTAGYLIPSIDSDVLSFQNLPTNWVGREDLRLTATDTATDEMLSDSDTVIFEVKNQTPPVLADIPDQEIDEGESLVDVDLSDYLSGLDPSEVTWALTGADTLNPELNGTILSFTLEDENYFGTETLSITASSQEDTELSDSDEITLVVNNVNDAPQITTDPNTEVHIGVLYEYELQANDIDNEDLEFTINNLPDWLFFVPGDNNAVLLGIPQEADIGEYSMEITVSDGELMVSQTIDLEVKLSFANILTIDNQQINEGHTFDDLDLSQYLDKTGDISISWEVDGGNELSASIINDDFLSVQLPNEDWYGQEIFTVILRNVDSGEIEDQQDVTYTVINVNDAPVITTSPSDAVQVGDLYEYNVEATDIDNEALTFTIDGMPSWLSFVTGEKSAVLLGLPEETDLGSYSIEITVSDGELSVSQTVDIDVATSFARVESITNQQIDEGQTFSDLDLSQYLNKTDDVITEWEVQGGTELTASIVNDNSLAVAVPSEDWFGEETFTVILRNTVTDEIADQEEVTYTVNNINDAPEIITTPSNAVQVGTLYEYDLEATDIDNTELSFTTEGMPAWMSIVTGDKSAVLLGIPEESDLGSHSIVITVSDGELSASQTVEIEVATSFARIETIAQQQIEEGQEFSNLDLTQYLNKTDDISVIWEVQGGSELTSSIVDDHFLDVEVPNADWFGQETLTVILRNSNTNDIEDQEDVVYQVTNVNDSPVITSSPSEIAEPGVLYEYLIEVTDIDDDAVTFTVQGLPDWLSFVPGDKSASLLGIPAESDLGNYTIDIMVSDDEFTVSQTVNLDVESTFARIENVTNQQVQEGDTFADLDLNQFLNKTDDISVTWEVSGQSELTASIVNDHFLSVQIPNTDWFGQETLMLSLRNTENNEIEDQSEVIYEVININDAPTFLNNPELTAVVGSLYQSVVEFEDLDNDNLTGSFSGPDWITHIFESNSLILFGIPEESDIGSSAITISISDGFVGVSETYSLSVETEVVEVGVSTDIAKLNIYPNPASNIIHLEDHAQIQYILITSMDGRNVYRYDLNEKVNIDVTNLKPGIYVITAENYDGNIFVSKLIKE